MFKALDKFSKGKYSKMTFVLDAVANCDSQWKAVMAGAGSAVLGIDRALPLPSAVHWGLAGVLVDQYCKGRVIPSDIQQMAMCALGGYAGGFGVRLMQNAGVPFTGPLLI